MPDAKPEKSPGEIASLSDENWRWYPKVLTPRAYLHTGGYSGRVKIEGKIFRESLATAVFITAKEKLGDYVKKQRKEAGAFDCSRPPPQKHSCGDGMANDLF